MGNSLKGKYFDILEINELNERTNQRFVLNILLFFVVSKSINLFYL